VIFLVANFRHFAKNIFQLKYSVANSFIVSGKKELPKKRKKKVHQNSPHLLTTIIFLFVAKFRNLAIFFPEKRKKKNKTDTHTIHLFVILEKKLRHFLKIKN
jgi:hypothetical protein